MGSAALRKVSSTARMHVGLGLLTVVTVALLLRLHAIDRESLWLDEAYTYFRASMPLGETIQRSIERHHNPSYFVFMHYWIRHGDDEWMLRLPSAIFGACTVGAVFLLGYVVGRARAAWVAASLALLSPVQIYYSQEARMYAPLTLAATLSMIGLVWLGMHRHQACRPWFGLQRVFRGQRAPSSRAKLAWCAYVAGTIIVLYLHNTGVIFAATAGSFALLVALACGQQRARFLANLAAASAIVLAVWALYLRTLVSQAHALVDHFWAKFPSWKAGAKVLRELYLMDAALVSVLGVLLLSASAAGVFVLRKRWHVALGLVLLGVLGPALLLLVSLHTPMFGTRLLIWSSLPVFVLIGAGVSTLRHPAWSVLFVCAVTALVSPRLAHGYQHLDKERWRPILAELQTRARPDALIVLPSAQEVAVLHYYLHRKDGPLRALRTVMLEEGADVRAQLGGASQVFLIDRKKGRRTAGFVSTLVQRGRLTSTKLWNRKIRIDEVDLSRPPKRKRAKRSR